MPLTLADEIAAGLDETITREVGIAYEAAINTIWACEPEALRQLLAVLARDNVDERALLLASGQPLRGGVRATVREGGIAIVQAIGVLAKRANLMTEISGATSTEMLARDIAIARDDPTVRAIVLAIDSPGGAVPLVSETAAMIREASAVKPVHAYISGHGASAAYWLATAAESITIEATAQVGSIGVYAAVRRNPADPKVVEWVSSQSPRKAIDPATPEGRADVQRVVDDMAAVFVADVARYRGVTEERVIEEWGAGGVLVGARAVAAGMVDRVGSLEQLIAGLAGDGGSMMSGTRTGTTEGSALTVERVIAEAPEVAAALRDQGAKAAAPGIERAAAEQIEAARIEARAAGATAERERIQGVLALALDGHEDLLQALAFDGKTTPAEAAVQVVQAEQQRGAGWLERRAASNPNPVPTSAASPAIEHQADAAALGNIDPEDPKSADALRERWNASPALRAEFPDVETWVAYALAAASGRVRVLAGRTAA